MERHRKNTVALSTAQHSAGHWKAWMFLIAITLLLWSVSALADESEQVPFNFGDDCALLEQLTPEQLEGLTDYGNRGYWHDFCRINNSENCDQYSYLFEEIGELTWVNDSEGLCQFVRRHTMQEDGPTIFPNFGSYLPEENFGPYFPLDKFGLNPPQ